jgi:hypothetical protein
MFGRILRQYVEEFMVAKLSDNKSVQRVAVKTVEATKNMGEALKDTEGLKSFATDVWRQLREEAARDMRAADKAASSGKGSGGRGRIE